MQKKFFRLLVACLLLFSLVGVASAQGEVVLIIGWEQEPDVQTLISSSAFSSYLDAFFHRDVWDWAGEDREIFPVMVEEVPTFENGLVTTVPVTGDFDGDGTEEEAEAPVITYRLRSGMLWSDGTPITADDCMFYHNLMMQPNPVDSVNRGFYPQVVESAEKIDDLTVVLTYNTPYPDFHTIFPLQCGYPSHILTPLLDTDSDGVFDANIDETQYFLDWTQTIGYGPYVVSEYNPGQNMVFTRNANWGVNEYEVVPAADRVVTQYIIESEQMQNALQVGDIDMAFNFTTPIGYDTMENVDTWGTIGVFVDALWLNMGANAHPAMQDQRVRSAIGYAIDRRTLADQLVSPGAGEAIPLSWFPGQFTPDDTGFREYDVAEATRLLDESGWVDSNSNGTRDLNGIELVLRFFTTPRAPRPDYQTFIQAQLQEVGIATQLFVVDGPTVLFASFSDRGILNTGQYDLAIFGRSNNPLAPGTGSPQNWHCAGIPSVENPGGLNSSFLCDEDFDRLDTAVSLTNDPAERLVLHEQLEPILYEAAIWHGLYVRIQWYAVRSDRWNVDSMRTMGTLSNNFFNQMDYWQPAS